MISQNIYYSRESPFKVDPFSGAKHAPDSLRFGQDPTDRIRNGSIYSVAIGYSFSHRSDKASQNTEVGQMQRYDALSGGLWGATVPDLLAGCFKRAGRFRGDGGALAASAGMRAACVARADPCMGSAASDVCTVDWMRCACALHDAFCTFPAFPAAADRTLRKLAVVPGTLLLGTFVAPGRGCWPAQGCRGGGGSSVVQLSSNELALREECVYPGSTVAHTCTRRDPIKKNPRFRE